MSNLNWRKVPFSCTIIIVYFGTNIELFHFGKILPIPLNTEITCKKECIQFDILGLMKGLVVSGEIAE